MYIYIQLTCIFSSLQKSVVTQAKAMLCLSLLMSSQTKISNSDFLSSLIIDISPMLVLLHLLLISSEMQPPPFPLTHSITHSLAHSFLLHPLTTHSFAFSLTHSHTHSLQPSHPWPHTPWPHTPWPHTP